MKEIIGKRITKIRKDLHMNKTEFSRFIGISNQFLGQIERGESGLPVEKIKTISEKTGITTDYIILGKDNITFTISNMLSNLNEEELNIVLSTSKIMIESIKRLNNIK